MLAPMMNSGANILTANDVAGGSHPVLLVADDEPEIVALLDEYFTAAGYEVLAAYGGAQALELAQRAPDLAILDVGMPDMDGYAVCRRLREHLSCPIIFLTARVEEADTLEGFAAGADDYVVKPFSLQVLAARVKAHLSREARKSVKAQVRFDGDITIDYLSRVVTVADKRVELTRREFDIVAFLSKHPGQVFERERIHEEVVGWEQESSPLVITEHVRRIRSKFAKASPREAVDPIETVWGMGYRWRV